jgi:ketosteroid isomerase-like protein
MMKMLITAGMLLLTSTLAQAQTVGSDADHTALRKLLADTLTSVNAKDYAAAQKLLHDPFRVTVLTQDSFTNFNAFKEYYEKLYNRSFLQMKTIRLNAVPDEKSQIYEGVFAVNGGETEEFYELTDGRTFTMKGRWTAVTTKQNGEWKILAVHTGINPIDNPILTAIEKSTLWFGGITGGVGLILGLMISWLASRFRRRTNKSPNAATK